MNSDNLNIPKVCKFSRRPNISNVASLDSLGKYSMDYFKKTSTDVGVYLGACSIHPELLLSNNYC